MLSLLSPVSGLQLCGSVFSLLEEAQDWAHRCPLCKYKYKYKYRIGHTGNHCIASQFNLKFIFQGQKSATNVERGSAKVKNWTPTSSSATGFPGRSKLEMGTISAQTRPFLSPPHLALSPIHLLNQNVSSPQPPKPTKPQTFQTLKQSTNLCPLSHQSTLLLCHPIPCPLHRRRQPPWHLPPPPWARPPPRWPQPRC